MPPTENDSNRNMASTVKEFCLDHITSVSIGLVTGALFTTAVTGFWLGAVYNEVQTSIRVQEVKMDKIERTQDVRMEKIENTQEKMAESISQLQLIVNKLTVLYERNSSS